MQASQVPAAGVPDVLSVDALDPGSGPYVSAAYAQACTGLVQQLRERGYVLLRLSPQTSGSVLATLSGADAVLASTPASQQALGVDVRRLPGKDLLEWRLRRHSEEVQDRVSLTPEEWERREGCSKASEIQTMNSEATRKRGSLRACDLDAGIHLTTHAACSLYL